MSDLAKTSQVFDALLAAAPDAILIADANGAILDANAAADTLFGYDGGALVGQSVNTLMPPGTASRHDGFVSQYLATGAAQIIGTGRELEGKRQDGTLFPLFLTIGHARIDGQDVFVANLHDLSLRRKIERALERSQRMEALGQLTGGVAHDFNNLLTIISGNLELLESAITDPGTCEIVADALEAAQIGTALTGQLLSFARRGVLMPERVEANQVVGDMAGLLRRTMGAGVHVHTTLEPNLWPIMVDPTQIHTALLNLAMNARTAMPSGGTLTIKTENAAVDDAYIAQEIDVAQGDYVRITVSDTGLGMSENTRKRAFEPFFTTKPGSQGTGLGLSLVYGFVRQSGGHVTLYSEVGQGSTFCLYFPKDEAAEAGPARPAPRPHEAALATEGLLVLVVEDNPSILSLTTKRLAALGYDTLEAGSADAALALLDSRRDIGIVFSDIIMPGSMTGYELAQLVRKRDPSIGILLTTAFSGELLDQGGALQVGFEMLRKPYRQEDLVNALKRVTSALSRPSRPL